MVGTGKAGHLGGSSSLAEIMAVLYFHAMRFDPTDPRAPGRDRFLLSKGHAVLAQDAALAELGVVKLDDLERIKTLDGVLQGHPDMERTPGIEAVTGSLGQGLSIANGMALGLRLDGKGARVHVVLGDGELSEGQVWEAAMASANYRVDNLTAILDRNGVQASGTTRVLEIRGPSGNSVDRDRHDAFRDVLNKSGRKFEVVEVVGKWDDGTGQKAAADAIAVHKKFDGIYTQGGSTGAVRALLDSGHPMVPIAGETENGFRKLCQQYDPKGLHCSSAGTGPAQVAVTIKAAIAALEGATLPQAIALPTSFVSAPAGGRRAGERSRAPPRTNAASERAGAASRPRVGPVTAARKRRCRSACPRAGARAGSPRAPGAGRRRCRSPASRPPGRGRRRPRSAW